MPLPQMSFAYRALPDSSGVPDHAIAALDALERLENGFDRDAPAALRDHAAEMERLGMPATAEIARSLAEWSSSSASRAQRLDLAARFDAIGLHAEAEGVHWGTDDPAPGGTLH